MNRTKMIAAALAAATLVIACSQADEEGVGTSSAATTTAAAQVTLEVEPGVGTAPQRIGGKLFIPSTSEMNPPTAHVFIDKQLAGSVPSVGYTTPSEVQDGYGNTLGYGLLYTFGVDVPDDFEDDGDHDLEVFFTSADGKTIATPAAGGGSTPSNPSTRGSSPDGTIDYTRTCNVPATNYTPASTSPVCCNISCNSGDAIAVKPRGWSSRGATGEENGDATSATSARYCVWGVTARGGITFTAGCDH